MFKKMIRFKTRWLLAVTGAALLAMGLAGGTVLAATGSINFTGDGPRLGAGHAPASHGRENVDAVMARVAEIVGVEQTELEGAFRTARDEQAVVRFDARIDELIADETITKEQGDEAKSWFDTRPAQTGPVAIMLAITDDAQWVDKILVRLVEAEIVTQEEADALADWHADRPDSLPAPERQHGAQHRR